MTFVSTLNKGDDVDPMIPETENDFAGTPAPFERSSFMHTDTSSITMCDGGVRLVLDVSAAQLPAVLSHPVVHPEQVVLYWAEESQ